MKFSLSLLKENGFIEYANYYLLFGGNDNSNSDYASPIFDKNNKEIGYAYRFNSKIKDYSSYIINDEYKAMLKLYFYYQQFHSELIKKIMVIFIF